MGIIINGLTDTVTAADGSLNIGGDVTIPGELSYEDVTNIDSVGVITARSDVSIADKIVHTGDTDTAIRFPGADQVSIETGGTQRLLIGSDGKLVHSTSGAETVDFGTSNSSGSYHRYDLGSSGATLGFIGAGSQIVSGSNVADFGIRSQANLVLAAGGDVERARVTSDGKFGLGTQTPATKLNVIGDARVEGFSNAKIQIKRTGNTVANGSIEFLGSDNSFGWGLIANYDAGGSNFNIKEGSNSRLYIKSGNIGINETNPTSSLVIKKSNNSGVGPELVLNNSSGSYGDEMSILFSSGGTPRSGLKGGITVDGQGSGWFNLSTRNPSGTYGERIRVNSSGNLIVDAGGDAQDIQIKSHSANSGHGVVYLRGNASNESSSIQLNHYGHADYRISAGRSGNGMFSITRTDGGSDGILMDSTGNMGLGVTPVYSGVFGGSQKVLHIGGTTAPGLRIQSSTTNQGDFIIQSGNSGGATYLSNLSNNADTVFYNTSGGSITERVRIYHGGQVAKPNQPAFNAKLSTATGANFNGFISFNAVDHNIGSHYNGSNGRFTAPLAGRYLFSFYTNVYRDGGSGSLWADWYVNNSAKGHRMYTQYSSGWELVGGSIVLSLSQNDYVQIYAGTSGNWDGGSYGSFNGYFLG